MVRTPHIIGSLLGLSVLAATLATGYGLFMTFPRPTDPSRSSRVSQGTPDLLRSHVCGTNCLCIRYPAGNVKSHTSLSNGLPEGLSVGWYSNGVRQVEEHFQAGVSHGLRTKWYENTRKQSEATIVNGKIEGLFRRWHDNGKLAEEIAMANNLPDGQSLAYYPSGCLKARATLRAGKVVSQQHWQDGELPSEEPKGANK